jgi:hypothetical protein
MRTIRWMIRSMLWAGFFRCPDCWRKLSRLGPGGVRGRWCDNCEAFKGVESIDEAPA